MSSEDTTNRESTDSTESTESTSTPEVETRNTRQSSRLRTISAILGVFSVILLQLSGIFICNFIVKEGTSDVVPKPTFLTGLTIGLAWCHYTLHTGSTIGFFVWMFVIIANFCYSSFYYCYSSDKATLHAYYLLILIFLLTAYIYIHYTLPPHEMRDAAGTFAVFVVILTLVFPLNHVKMLLSSETTHSLPHLWPQIVTKFITSILFVWNGYLRNDLYVQVANLVSSIVSTVHLCVFWLYTK